MNSADHLTPAVHPTPLIGRGSEVAALQRLLRRAEARLVTVRGPAGVGKSRLAAAAAAAVRDRFADGLAFVDLSSVPDADEVLPAIARALALEIAETSTVLDQVAGALGGQSRLVVLDNAEHVAAAANDLVALLERCGRLQLLVTSRRPLRVRWEHVFEVAPLALPDLGRPFDARRLRRVPAIAMFLDRARAAGGDVRVDAASAPVVSELCARLDGLPLALELAATHTRSLSPAALLARIEHRLDLLTDGLQDQPPRHRTLRAALTSSYDLLTTEQRTVFRRLGVFPGGISLDAAQAVVGTRGGEAELLAHIAALVDHSLLRREALGDDEPRFRMLETTRDFARERLAASGERDDAELAHATFWRRLAEATEPELRGPAQLRCLDRLEHEWPNIEGALGWCVRTGRGEIGVRLAAALGWFWYLRGDRSVGRVWCERFSRLAADVPTAAPARARALSAAGLFAQYEIDLPAALALQEEALALAEEIGDPAAVALAHGRLAHLCLFRIDFARGAALAAASHDECRRRGDRWGVAFALSTRGLIARSENQLADATRLLLEALALFREHGDRWGIAHVLLGLGQIAHHQGDAGLAAEYWEERLALSGDLRNETAVGHTLDLLAALARQSGDHARAAARLEAALAIRRKFGDRRAISWVLHGMGELALERGDRVEAYARLRESLLLRRQMGDQAGAVASLVAFARLAAVVRRPRRALRLAGAAEALYQAMGPALAVQHYSLGVVPSALAAADPDVARARRLLGGAQRSSAWHEGEELTLDQVVAEALALEHELVATVDPPARAPAIPASGRGPSWEDLTRREREVAELLARGYTNRQIAETLVITVGSAHLHVVRLLAKLGFHTRAHAAAWAVAQGASSAAG